MNQASEFRTAGRRALRATLLRPAKLVAKPLRGLLSRQMNAVLARNSLGAQPRGPRRGVVEAHGRPLSLLILGDSTVNGSDIPTHALSLGGQLAASLSARTRRTVRWAVLARGGVTPRQIVEKYAGKVARYEPDVILVGLGANSLPQSHSTREWGAALADMIDELRSRAGAVPVVLTATPRVRRMKAVPQPLRAYWALRNSLFDAETKRVAHATSQVFIGPPYPVAKAEHLGPDGCHPSPAGYTVWGERLADTIVPLLPGS